MTDDRNSGPHILRFSLVSWSSEVIIKSIDCSDERNDSTDSDAEHGQNRIV